ncbi:LysR family transcriptional regulator [Pullulanibacillus camelliae]|uniref:LysR family transcriptional regulator n=1 Tax=Pullulanibacillus camelliae TaxID=1707096 RepID=A0A8J2YG00_9BACL|nr:LysR family transcriptional regulator [Pullulanibacillus camelliae]GGE35951.1 LysR family transcriptional regulator [Pullulanibacillus camelliae]
MELLQLQYFQVVARLQHITAAAKSLHVTQSSLSKTIQRLEEDLGVPLFDRTGRVLRLNKFGRAFLNRVDKALFELAQGRQEISDLSSSESGSVELAVTTANSLTQILQDFRVRRPHAHFHVQMLKTEEMLEPLHRGEIDFCLSSPPIHGEDLECKIIALDSFVLAVPKGHHFVDRNSVSILELKDELFVGLKHGYSTRDLTDRVCQSVGFTPKHVYEGDEPARLRSLVEAEIGIAFIPETSTWSSSQEEHVKFLRVEELKSMREIGLSWHRSRYLSHAALDFRKIVLEYFKGLPREGNHSF